MVVIETPTGPNRLLQKYHTWDQKYHLTNFVTRNIKKHIRLFSSDPLPAMPRRWCINVRAKNGIWYFTKVGRNWNVIFEDSGFAIIWIFQIFYIICATNDPAAIIKTKVTILYPRLVFQSFSRFFILDYSIFFICDFLKTHSKFYGDQTYTTRFWWVFILSVLYFWTICIYCN